MGRGHHERWPGHRCGLTFAATARARPSPPPARLDLRRTGAGSTFGRRRRGLDLAAAGAGSTFAAAGQARGVRCRHDRAAIRMLCSTAARSRRQLEHQQLFVERDRLRAVLELALGLRPREQRVDVALELE